MSAPVAAAAAAPAPEAAAAAPAPAAAVDMSKYGSHDITCDGCCAKPVIGFRYKCTRCDDHDICEACLDKFKKGVLPHTNKLNNVSRDVAAHSFQAYSEGKSFTPIGGAPKQAPKSSAGKVKPNDPCSCGSAKKFKKCCGDPSKK